MKPLDDPKDYAEAVEWFNECKARRVKDKKRIAELEAEVERVRRGLRFAATARAEKAEAALDEATAMLQEAALDHVADNETGFEIDNPTFDEYVAEYLDDLRRRAKRGES